MNSGDYKGLESEWEEGSKTSESRGCSCKMLSGPREKDAIHSLDCMQHLRETSCVTEMSLVGWYSNGN